MARRPHTVVDPAKPFYIYDDRINPAELNILGAEPFKVEQTRDGRVIYMTEAQAQYFIDQGAMGDKPLGKMSAAADSVNAQLVGAGDEAIKDDGSKAAAKLQKK